MSANARCPNGPADQVANTKPQPTQEQLGDLTRQVQALENSLNTLPRPSLQWHRSLFIIVGRAAQTGGLLAPPDKLRKDLMAPLLELNLLRVLNFYLASMFLISIFMRLRQYEAIVRLLRALPDRWPRLMQLVGRHRNIFLTWTTLLPAILALVLTIINSLATRLIWPNAELTLHDLANLWVAAVFVILTGAAMLGVDFYATFTVGKLDRGLMEGYFDQAEYWLRSWAAPVVRVFTLGYVNPRRMVHEEVRKALLETSKLLNSTLWWVTVQVGVRIAFGLTMWLTWACS